MKTRAGLFVAALSAVVLASLPATSLAFQSSPTAAMRAYHDAARTKDTAALKKLLSSRSLKALENPDVPVDRVLLAMTRDVPDAMPGMRNEKITGDQASLEVEDTKTGRWETVLFVKEDGAWKLALDQMDEKKK